MLEHSRRILLVIAILVISGWLYRSFRPSAQEPGLFEWLGGNAKLKTATQKDTPKEPVNEVVGEALLSSGDVPTLTRMSEESAKLAAAVLPAVVSIDTESAVETPPRNVAELLRGFGLRRQIGLGSGVFVSSEGHIITNLHVIKDAAEIAVTTSDGESYRAKLVGANSQTDIAVLKLVGAKKDYPWLKFADSDQVRTGQMVFAVGNPFGFSGTVTQGIISATERHLKGTAGELLQTSATINPGNSGGPLVDTRGEIVGINWSIYSLGAEKVRTWQGVGLAIPANEVKDAYQRILEQGERAPPIGYLGIRQEENTVVIGSGQNAMLGVVVKSVEPNSPAEAAGLRTGDVVVAVNGNRLTHPDQLYMVVFATPPGANITIAILREGQPMNVRVTLKPWSQSN